ncbi:hypothetical protein [Saccharopolyspora sp. CA-218241]|uniref:hypothetical protein n=1 Tax=Saccharopolyspora sp. CA-218241 TaxID=3240027 RepID=UPI003D96669E
MCDHPLRGAWLELQELDGVVRPGEHVPCSSCVAIDGTARRFAQALRVSGPPTPTGAPRWEVSDPMRETRPLPRPIEACAPARAANGPVPGAVG